MKVVEKSVALLALGANLGDPYSKLSEAVDAIAQEVGRCIAVSPFYTTEPLNPPALQNESQPNFVNAVVKCRCVLEPPQLLEVIQKIEKQLGRQRKSEIPWGPRVIDIDVLALGQTCYSGLGLTIPHPEIHNRDFVLYPLRDVEPGFIHPVLQLTVEQMIYNYHAKGNPNRIIGSDYLSAEAVNGAALS